MNTENETLQEAKEPLPAIFYLATVFIISLSSFLFVEIFREQLYFVMSPTTYLLFHNFVELFSVIISFSIFTVGVLSYRQSQDNHLFFLSCMFLGVGLIDLMHTLSFPGMPAFITQSSTNKGILFWLSARFFFAAAFLASAFVDQKLVRSALWKWGVFLAPIVFSLVVFVGAIYYEQQLPAMFVPGVGLTSLKVYLEYLVIGVMFLAYFAYVRRYIKTGERIFLLYLSAITISIFSELAFTLYRSAYDTFNALGHVYKFAAFCFIYWGIYTTSVLLPYRKLSYVLEQMKKYVFEWPRSQKVIEEVEKK